MIPNLLNFNGGAYITMILGCLLPHNTITLLDAGIGSSLINLHNFQPETTHTLLFLFLYEALHGFSPKFQFLLHRFSYISWIIIVQLDSLELQFHTFRHLFDVIIYSYSHSFSFPYSFSFSTLVKATCPFLHYIKNYIYTLIYVIFKMIYIFSKLNKIQDINF